MGQASSQGVPAAPGPAPEGRGAAGTPRWQGGPGVKANCWIGANKVEVQDVPDPKILNSRDAVVKITSTAICGSDLHLLDGYVPTMESGDVLGHEFMGEVVEVGPGVAGAGPSGAAPGRAGGGCRSAPAWSPPSRSPAAPASPAGPSCTPAARTPTPT